MLVSLEKVRVKPGTVVIETVLSGNPLCIIQINHLKVLGSKIIFLNQFDADSDMYLNKSVHVHELPVHACELLDLNQCLYWS